MKAVNLKELLEMYGQRTVDALRQQMEAEADAIVRDMQSRAPVKTGKLKGSIHWKWNRNKTAITIIADASNNGVKYGRIVEFSPKINKPFFYPALDAHKDEYKQKLIETLRKEARKAVD